MRRSFNQSFHHSLRQNSTTRPIEGREHSFVHPNRSFKPLRSFVTFVRPPRAAKAQASTRIPPSQARAWHGAGPPERRKQAKKIFRRQSREGLASAYFSRFRSPRPSYVKESQPPAMLRALVGLTLPLFAPSSGIEPEPALPGEDKKGGAEFPPPTKMESFRFLALVNLFQLLDERRNFGNGYGGRNIKLSNLVEFFIHINWQCVN